MHADSLAVFFQELLSTKIDRRHAAILGSCRKVWNRGGGRDLTGSPTLLDGEKLGYQATSSDKHGP